MAEQPQKKKLSMRELAVKKANDAWSAIPEVGKGHAAAMGRLGLAELRQAASFGAGSIEQPTPPGIFGAPTQGEIAEARGGPGSGPEQERKKSIADLYGHAAEKAQEAERRMDRGQERGSLDM